jgi:hypothetical protein
MINTALRDGLTPQERQERRKQGGINDDQRLNP